MVHRQVEEPLHLMLVEIHRQHPVRPRHRHHVRHQLGADRDPRLVLPVLPGIPEVGYDRGDPGGAGPSRRVHEEQQLEQVLSRRVGRLNDVNVSTADVLIDLDEQLTVSESLDGDLAERLSQLCRNLLREGRLADPLRRSIWLRDIERSFMAAAAQNSRGVGVRSIGAGGREGGKAHEADRTDGADRQFQIFNFQFAIIWQSI